MIEGGKVRVIRTHPLLIIFVQNLQSIQYLLFQAELSNYRMHTELPRATPLVWSEMSQTVTVSDCVEETPNMIEPKYFTKSDKRGHERPEQWCPTRPSRQQHAVGSTVHFRVHLD